LNNLAYHQLKFLDLPSEAIRTYHESIELFSNLGDLRGITYTCYDISKAYLQVGLVDEARNYCLRSLHTAMTLDNVPLILHALHGFVNFYAKTNQSERALGLCYLILNHPQVQSDTQKRSAVSRVELETKLNPAQLKSARDWAEITELQGVIDQTVANGNSSGTYPLFSS
jgi:hypothetical protein